MRWSIIIVMRRKVILYLLTFILTVLPVNSARAFLDSNPNGNVYNINQKLDYVNICWWENFNDPILKEYIVKAVKCNHDLKKASWQTEEYRNFIKLSFSQELPWFGTSVDNTLVKTPRLNGNMFQRDVFTLPFWVNYEADFFLKNRDKTKASKKTYIASQFEEQSIYISMASNVATTYVNVIKYDKLIELQKRIVDLRCEILKRKEKQLRQGVITAIDFNEVKKNYDSAKNSLNDLVKYRGKALNQLAVFIGESACNSEALNRSSFDKFEYNSIVPDCVSSDIVFSRPDILAAENKLEKGKIDVRVARKEFLPRFNVFGVYSFNTISGNFFGWQTALAYLLTGATQDLFKGGYKIANLKIYKSRYEQLFEAYKQADLIALQEVNDSLLFIKQDTQIDNSTLNKLNTQRDSYYRQLNQYKNGVISCPDLLAYQEALLSYEQEKVNSKTNRLVDYITLYKAVGGKL